MKVLYEKNHPNGLKLAIASKCTQVNIKFVEGKSKFVQ